MLLKGRRVINITDELNQKIVKQALWLRVRVARSSKRGTQLDSHLEKWQEKEKKEKNKKT